MKVIFKNKMCEVIEKLEDKEIGGILYKVYKIKNGRKSMYVKVDAFNGQCFETEV